MNTLKKIFKNYLRKENNFIDSILINDNENLRINFEEFSFIEQEKIINLIIDYYDKKKEFINISGNDLDISFIGSFNIKKIENITLLNNCFYISEMDHYNYSVYIEDLKVLRKYYYNKKEK